LSLSIDMIINRQPDFTSSLEGLLLDFVQLITKTTLSAKTRRCFPEEHVYYTVFAILFLNNRYIVEYICQCLHD